MGIKVHEIRAFSPPNSSITSLQDRIEDGLNVNSIPSDSGLLHSGVPRKHLTFREAANNSVIQHMGAYIVLGTDRPSHLGTGGGASGYSNDDAIDIVVGRGQNLKSGKVLKSDMSAQETEDYYGDGPPEGFIVGPMFTADAARIYVSSRTNIDHNFGIASTPRDAHLGSNAHPVSGIGIKADRVRMIARDNIKIVTGQNQGFTGGKELNSLGGVSTQAGTISLIGGNYTAAELKLAGLLAPDGVVQSIPYLQPAIKGDNLTQCLEALFAYVDKIEGAVYNMALQDLAFRNALQADPLISPISKPVIGLGATLNKTFVTSALYETRAWALGCRQKYLEYGGTFHIRSSNVYLT